MPVIKELKNPCTEEYLKLKKHFHGDVISWFYYSSSTTSVESEEDIPFYSHKIMERPSKHEGTPYTQITSEYFNPVYLLLKQIFECNQLDVSVIYRINLNATFSVPINKRSPYHIDLDIPHKNLLIYMSKFEGGELFIKDNDQEIKIPPKEDDVLLFDGSLEHCISAPKGADRRIVLVVNFL
jgi:hypothetical protein